MRYLIIALLVSLTLSCSTDDYRNNNNPNLITVPVNYVINLNLPEYNNLKYPGGTATIRHIGIQGVVVFALNKDFYTAYELSDPNHPTSSCSAMIVEGAMAKCKCPDDNNEYNLLTGEHKSEKDKYPMLGYRIKKEGNNLRIYN